MSRRSPRDSRAGRSRRPRLLRGFAVLLAAFAVASALAGLLGAANLGTALAFGQIGFALALVYLLLRR